MADAADHGYRASHDSACQGLVIESPEVFHGATAAHQQKYINFSSVHGFLERRQQFARRLNALYAGRVNHHRDMGRTPHQGADRIVQSRRTQRSDDSHRTRQQRQRAFTGAVKQPLCLEFGFEAGELFKPIALPGLEHGFDHQLQLAARLVNTQPAAHLHQLTIPGHKVDQRGCPLEHGAAHLTLFIFKVEIAVPAGSTGKAGNLTLDSHRVKARLQTVGNRPYQRANRPHPHRGGCCRSLFWLKLIGDLIHGLAKLLQIHAPGKLGRKLWAPWICKGLSHNSHH